MRETREDDGPERRCIVSREARTTDDMIRFVVGPDGALVPDLRRRLPGRGVWVTATAAAVREAVKRRAFGRSLKAQVTVSPSLVGDIDALMERDCLQALSFANKAGEAITGFVKVESAITRDDVVAVIHAREAADDGIRKIGQALRRRYGDPAPEKIKIVASLAGADLDLALGGAHVIHAALVAGPASAGFLARWRRLVHFRGLDAAGCGPVETGGGRPDESGQSVGDGADRP